MTRHADQLRTGPEKARHRLVLLHGWGADASDLLDLGAMLVGPEVSVVALQAPGLHPSGQGRQWYDLQEPNWPGLPEARQALATRLKALAAELPLECTVLLGFSQGAALGLDVATAAGGLPLAGLISCSGYPHPGWLPEAPGKQTPRSLLLTHGRQDPVVPYAASLELDSQLRRMGHAVELVGFSGGHTIDIDLCPRLRAFLRSAWNG